MTTSGEKPATDSDLVIPVVEEEAFIETRTVSAGRVRIRQVSDTVEEIATATLEGETLEVSRVSIDRVVTEAPPTRTEDGVTIIPVLEEVLFVEKRLVLKEELHIRRHATTETVKLPVKLRKQRAIVERLDANAEPEPGELKS